LSGCKNHHDASHELNVTHCSMSNSAGENSTFILRIIMMKGYDIAKATRILTISCVMGEKKIDKTNWIHRKHVQVARNTHACSCKCVLLHVRACIYTHTHSHHSCTVDIPRYCRHLLPPISTWHTPAIYLTFFPSSFLSLGGKPPPSPLGPQKLSQTVVYVSFHWIYYIPKIHQIIFLGISHGVASVSRIDKIVSLFWKKSPIK